MFERNHSDSKKRASLEARPIPQPSSAVPPASTIREKEVAAEPAVAVPQRAGLLPAKNKLVAVATSVDALVEIVSSPTAAGAEVSAVDTKVVEIPRVVSLEGAADEGPVPIATSKGEEEEVPSAAAGHPTSAAAVSIGLQEGNSECAQPAVLVGEKDSASSGHGPVAETDKVPIVGGRQQVAAVAFAGHAVEVSLTVTI